jgi:hypothetical protein
MTVIVNGARCTWWDSIDKASSIPRQPGEPGLPCCPHCRGVLFQYDSEGDFFRGVAEYEAAGHLGYGKMLEWARGKCFRNLTAMAAAYKTATGIIVP